MKERYAYIQKKDILALLDYERRIGVNFNQMPNQKFLDLLSDELKLPITNVIFLENNIVRVVAINPFDFSSPVLVDMFYDYFYALPQVDVEFDDPIIETN